LSVPFSDEEVRETFKAVQREIRPDLVFINTLRKVHDMDDKDSRTPKLVYSYFQKVFPQAALVFIHHIRKRPQDPKFLTHDKEAFSGAKNWLNDAQVGLHLESFGERKGELRLYHRKSQVSDTLRPLPLILTKDGSTLECPLFDELYKTYGILNDPPVDHDGLTIPKKDLDIYLAGVLGVAPITAKRRRLAIESGLFPGSREFLADHASDHSF
jgi:hypothetical protein